MTISVGDIQATVLLGMMEAGLWTTAKWEPLINMIGEDNPLIDRIRAHKDVNQYVSLSTLTTDVDTILGIIGFIQSNATAKKSMTINEEVAKIINKMSIFAWNNIMFTAVRCTIQDEQHYLLYATPVIVQLLDQL